MAKEVAIEETEPNQIWVFPVFHIDNDKENLFACADIFWVKPYGIDDHTEDEDVIDQIKRAGRKASELATRGITVTDHLYQLRDTDKGLDFRILKHEIYGDLKIFMVEGPSHDRRAVETGEVTIN